ncbi:MAG TPA: phosphoglucomutase/phosphomannomutase family protein [Flexilinea sp.]|nr:MAG: Phosphoglucomutase [Chloroflexi bacterium ADurb.Bin344]HOP02684.1 phosphoglucomutase/phosphomannomutase family protein [Flexilinea sp.]HPJ65969.1 phosphoglucomutase/phosphomannomutase family protein [Flexilinea sp.]HPR71024.1 phosphoglucomutase/phosphomannomutase family protein [Flexilinea sp.]
MAINFGTDGWRAVISDTFTFANLRVVSQAVADAVKSTAWEDLSKGAEIANKDRIVVGYDTRFLSDRYAKEVARVLAANGFKVFLSQSDAATPVISFATKQLGAIAGVMITASHNAPRYNGVKLKAAYGGGALPEQCKLVEVYLMDNETLGRGPNLLEYDKARELGLITTFNPLLEYSHHIRKLIDFDTIAEAKDLRIVVDSMYGSGRGVIRNLLGGTGVEVNEIRAELNPGFGGVHPEPIYRNLGALASALAAGLGNLGLATDGDADRIGAMDERGNFIDPHKIMALSIKYLHEKRGLSGALVRTVSTTRMIDCLGKKYGLEVFETPVGFNHISDHMMERDVLIGGEESGGISFKGHIPEGDGIIMGLLITEMVAAYHATLGELVRQLEDEIGAFYYDRTDLRLKHPVAKDEMIKSLVNNAPASIGGETIQQISTLDGVKYIMADDSWLLIRPSGTEPVLRVYAEGRSPQMVKELLGFGNLVAETVK